MKKLLLLALAFILFGCEVETVTKIETITEIVEIEKIVIEERLVQLTDEQLADINVISDAKAFEYYQAIYDEEVEAYKVKSDEALAQAIDELEPEIIYQDVIVKEIEYIEEIKYRTNTVYKDVPGETVYVNVIETIIEYVELPVEIIYEEIIVTEIEYLPSDIMYEDVIVIEYVEVDVIEYVEVIVEVPVEVIVMEYIDVPIETIIYEDVIVEIDVIEYITEIVEVPVEVTVIEFVEVTEYVTEHTETIVYEEVFVVDSEAIEAVTLEFNDYKTTHKYSNLQFLSTVDAMMGYVARITELQQEIADMG